MGLLVAAAQLAHELVASGEGGDGEEGEKEREGGVDVPLTEDDAEVGGVPCEEHLRGSRGSCQPVRNCADTRDGVHRRSCCTWALRWACPYRRDPCACDDPYRR